MDHQIGIPADGGSKMTVIVRRNAEMPQILGGILGFHHASQHHHGDRRSLGLSPGGLQHPLQGAVVGLQKAVPQGRQHGPESICLVLGRLLVDPVDGGAAEVKKVLCHRLICRQHELLDELFALSLLPGHNVHRAAHAVADDIALLGLQLQTAPVLPPLFQLFRQVRHVPEHGQNALIPFCQKIIGFPLIFR